jgi:hypothetical protein
MLDNFICRRISKRIDRGRDPFVCYLGKRYPAIKNKYLLSYKVLEVILLKPILKWQYDQIIKELLLLQDHNVDKACPCESDGERCERKHL